MKIESVKAFLVDRCLVVRVYTDEGIVGNGEAGLWAHHRATYELIRQISDYYVGKDPMLIEHHAQVVMRNTHFFGPVISAAVSAIDIALWDILGKSVGKPVYQLLGGKLRDKVKVFGNIRGGTLDDVAESARANLEKGFISMRTIPFPPGFEKMTSSKAIGSAVEIVKTIREVIGYDIDLGLEIHRNLSPNDAVILSRELEPYRILYYEDPLAPQSLEAMEYVARNINIPIATGERFFTIHQFKELIDRKIVGMIRPDLSLAGGYTQVKKIAAIAEAALVGYFPHLMGSPVNIAAYVQMDAAVPNYVLMEHYNVDNHKLNDIVDEPLTYENGYIIVPDKPGIGVEIQEDKLEKFPYVSIPIRGAFAADGSVAH